MTSRERFRPLYHVVRAVGPSRKRRLVLCLLTFSGYAATAASAQDTSKTTLDSLAAQLRRAEDRIDALEKGRADDRTSGVHTKSGIRLDLSGRVIVNGFFDTRRVNNVDDPQFVRPDTASSAPSRGLGLSPRQSMFTIALSVPDVAGGQFSGDLATDFYGGQQPSSGGRTFPLLRIRTAHATLDWANGQIMIAQDVPLISPLNPVSVVSSGTPDFAGAGNLWLWLPQIRGTLQTHSALTVGVQGAVLAPVSGDPETAFDTDFDPAEHSQRPDFEGRVFLRWNSNAGTGELGCGGHVGWIAVAGATTATAPSLVRSDAAACDLRAPIVNWLEVRGEGYTGQALRGLGGGGIAQELGVANVPIRDQGGWAQVNLLPLSIWTVGTGCGADQPNTADLAATARKRNVSCAAYVTGHPFGPIVLGLEGRRLVTTYASGRLTNDYLDLGIGFEY